MHIHRLALMQSLPDSCTPTTPFLAQISETFHTCVPTPLALLSTTLGTLSIVSWLFAQLPQIYKNHKIQSTAGLSIFFLVEWCLGDLANLLGALFTEQATWQVIVAGYYVFVDVCLVTQYFWYTHFKPWRYERSLHSDNDSEHGDSDSDILNGLSPINSNFNESEPPSPKKVDMDEASPSQPRDTVHFNNVTYEKAPMSIPNAATKGIRKDVLSSWQPGPSPRTVLYIATLCALISKTTASPLIPTHLVGSNSKLQITGTILSWFSTLLYLGSRLPQLYKNWQRRSTAGLSPLLFMAAFSGNFFYSTSLLTNPNAWNNFEPFGGHGWIGPEGSSRLAWISAAAPFFLGAAGVLGLDAAMGVQFLMYAERDEEKIVKVRDSSGRSQWQKVDGWMRGWVPSLVGKERVLSLAESQRLLSESREMSRSAFGTV